MMEGTISGGLPDCTHPALRLPPLRDAARATNPPLSTTNRPQSK